MKPKKLNVRLLRKIQRHILEEPRRFMMGHVIARVRPGEPFSDFGITFDAPACGTVACICGWACLLEGKTRTMEELDTARDLLGIVGSDLFYVSAWPKKYQDQWDRAKTPSGRARVAVRCIDYLIKGGESNFVKALV